MKIAAEPALMLSSRQIIRPTAFPGKIPLA